MIIFFSERGGLDTRIDKKRKEAEQRKMTLQPFLLFVGGNSTEFIDFYMIVNDVKYQFLNAQEAFKFLLQLFFTVDVQYPDSSAHIYAVMQVLCFDLKESGQFFKTQQNVLISELKC